MAFAIVLLSFLAGPRAHGQEPQPKAPLPQVELTPTANGLIVARAKESFSSISLAGSDLQPQPTLEGGNEETPQYVREIVRVQWRPNDPIDLYVIRPPGVKNPPVVLISIAIPAPSTASKTAGIANAWSKTGRPPSVLFRRSPDTASPTTR
jgi:hypothetical protein